MPYLVDVPRRPAFFFFFEGKQRKSGSGEEGKLGEGIGRVEGGETAVGI